MPNVQPLEWAAVVAAIGVYVLVPSVLAWVDARRARRAEAAVTGEPAPVSPGLPAAAGFPAAGPAPGAEPFAAAPAVAAAPEAPGAAGGPGLAAALAPPASVGTDLRALSATGSVTGEPHVPRPAEPAAPATAGGGPSFPGHPGPGTPPAVNAAVQAGEGSLAEPPAPEVPRVPMPYAFRLQELRLVRLDDVPPPAGFDEDSWRAALEEGRRRFQSQRRRIETLALRAPFPPQAFACAGAETTGEETARLRFLLFPGLWPTEAAEAGAVVEVTLRGDTIVAETVRPLRHDEQR